jgi:hypothetical protein
MLGLRLWTVTEKTLPDALAFNVRVSLYQMVHVERLDVRLFVPTFTDFVFGLDTGQAVGETAIQGVDWTLGKFLTTVRMAGELPSQ